jgi:hypothetical protein
MALKLSNPNQVKPQPVSVLIVLLVLALGLGWFYRFPGLGLRPMHVDEAILGIKFLEFWQSGWFDYDPKDYHGPLLHYLTLAFAKLMGWSDPAAITGDHLRLVVAVLAMGLVLSTLLVTDALVAISPTPPPLFDLDPTPLLFHAREVGSEPLVDTPANRLKGWKRIVLFANYFRPDCISVPSLVDVVSHSFAPGCRNARTHFGVYPFSWATGWEEEADHLLANYIERQGLCLAPVLERLVLPRSHQLFLEWLQQLARIDGTKHLIAAHYSAPHPLTSDNLKLYAKQVATDQWAPSHGPWTTLASIDANLIRFGLVPFFED